MGYDGKGQFVLEDIESAQKVYENVKNYPLILEKFCRFDDEVSVIVARSKTGEIKAYEPLTNSHKNGILERSFYPSKLSLPQKIKTQKTATKIVEKLDLIGIMAVEFFIVDNIAFSDYSIFTIIQKWHDHTHQFNHKKRS